MKESAIDIESLTVRYGKTAVLWDVSLRIDQGALVGILGPNGAGKSTLLKTALNLVSPISGQIKLLGRPFAKVRKKVAYVPQRSSVDWDFPMTAFDLVLMGRFGRLSLWNRPRKADRQATMAALEKVGMASFAERQIGQLSGGQQQRLFIARALVQGAELFLLDEPFAGVDLTTEKVLIDLLKRLKNEGKTICIVHHDLATVREYFDQLILLNTRLVACGNVQDVFNQETLSDTFGKNQVLFDEAAKLNATSQSGIL